jgi:hypothetical protein
VPTALREFSIACCTWAACSLNDRGAGPGCDLVKNRCVVSERFGTAPELTCRSIERRLSRVGVTGTAPVIMLACRNEARSMGRC